MKRWVEIVVQMHLSFTFQTLFIFYLLEPKGRALYGGFYFLFYFKSICSLIKLT
jgi:hypothetical protein